MLGILTWAGWIVFRPITFPDRLEPCPYWDARWGKNPSDNPYFDPEVN